MIVKNQLIHNIYLLQINLLHFESIIFFFLAIMSRNKAGKAWNLSKINLSFKISSVFLIHFALFPQTIKFAWLKFAKNKLSYF